MIDIHSNVHGKPLAFPTNLLVLVEDLFLEYLVDLKVDLGPPGPYPAGKHCQLFEGGKATRRSMMYYVHLRHFWATCKASWAGKET